MKDTDDLGVRSPLDVWRLRCDFKVAIRRFFTIRHYVEVDTPISVVMPGTEVHLDYFETAWIDIQKKSHRRYLRSSPELHMKRILAEGYKKIFQIGPCFRNFGELSSHHQPEFTMIEWYEVEVSYEDFIAQTIELVKFVTDELSVAWPKVAKWRIPEKIPRFSVNEAFVKFAEIELIDQDSQLAKKARARGIISVREDDDFETSFFKVLLDRIEPALSIHPLAVLYDYPPSQAALARVEGGVAKRFELYASGIELSNGFFELTDPEENQKRLLEANEKRQVLGKQIFDIDQKFLQATNRGLPSSCGNALGADRLLATICGLDSIDEVCPFGYQEHDIP